MTDFEAVRMTSRHAKFVVISVLLSATQVRSVYDANATIEYEKLERSNYVYREGDRNISFFGNETFLPQSFLFSKHEKLLEESEVSPKDPFFLTPVSRTVAETRDRYE